MCIYKNFFLQPYINMKYNVYNKENVELAIKYYLSNDCSHKEAAEKFDIKLQTYYKYLREYKAGVIVFQDTWNRRHDEMVKLNNVLDKVDALKAKKEKENITPKSKIIEVTKNFLTPTGKPGRPKRPTLDLNNININSNKETQEINVKNHSNKPSEIDSKYSFISNRNHESNSKSIANLDKKTDFNMLLKPQITKTNSEQKSESHISSKTPKRLPDGFLSTGLNIKFARDIINNIN